MNMIYVCLESVSLEIPFLRFRHNTHTQTHMQTDTYTLTNFVLSIHQVDFAIRLLLILMRSSRGTMRVLRGVCKACAYS